MRVFGQITTLVCFAATALAVGLSAQSRTAEQVLADTQAALGGAKIATVKTFVASGRTRRLSGNNLVPVVFQIFCELPDKYLRKDEIPAQENDPTSTGFNGAGLIQIPAPALPPAMPSGPARGPTPAAPPPPGAAQVGAGSAMPGRLGGAAPNPEAQLAAMKAARVLSAKQDFARLTLGMFATSHAGYPLTFAYVGQAEAPQGKAEVLDVKGEGGFALRLFVNAATHLPVMVSWTVPRNPSMVLLLAPGQTKPDTSAPGTIVVEVPAPLASTATAEEKAAYAKTVGDLRQQALGKPVEHRIYYADYRDTGGLQLPFRLRRAVGSDTIEETTFDEFRINAKIDAKRFEVVK